MARLQSAASKRVKIDKAQATMVGIIAGCVFVSVFSLVASKVLWSQRTYQARVISKKVKADSTLKQNIANVSVLVTSYKELTQTPDNVLGGNPNGTGDKDGDNARIVLDALPSKYDYPAVASSIEKLINDKGLKLAAIQGKDDEINQNKKQAGTDTPKPVDIPYEFSLDTNYTALQDLLVTLEKSIRPLYITKFQISGGSSNMKAVIDGKTFYQAEKKINIKQEVVQ